MSFKIPSKPNHSMFATNKNRHSHVALEKQGILYSQDNYVIANSFKNCTGFLVLVLIPLFFFTLSDHYY